MKCQFCLRKPSFSPLNYGDGAIFRFSIADCRFQMENATISAGPRNRTLTNVTGWVPFPGGIALDATSVICDELFGWISPAKPGMSPQSEAAKIINRVD